MTERKCVTPEYHVTHVYCPTCEWTLPGCEAVLVMVGGMQRIPCDQHQGHPGKHRHVVEWE